jgi:hypothetical protein
MKESPHKTELPLRQSEHGPGDAFPERHLYTHANIDDTHGFFEDAIHNPGDSGALHGFHESYSQRYGNANDFSQSHMPDFGFDAEGTASQDLKPSGQLVRFASHNDNRLLRGVENYAEQTSPSCRDRELVRGPPPAYSMHRRSFSLEVPSFALMPPFPEVSSRHSSAPPRAEGQAYGAFQRRFKGSEDAKQYRRNKMRMDRTPWKEPHTDGTIAKIESERDRHVERIYNALISGHRYRDNKASIAEKRWVTSAYYDPGMVEAYSHRVFDALMEQVKEGYRGWTQNDYVNDERKGEDDDKDADCEERLNNIIEALELEKTICENVMSSAWQIRMFVNAPKAYAKRKYQNRIGNSKRPNAKMTATDDDPRPSKRAKTVARGRQARGRSSTGPQLPISRSATPQQSFNPTGLPWVARPAILPANVASSPTMSVMESPYFPTSAMHVAKSPPMTSFLAPQAPSMRPTLHSQCGSFGPQQTIAMSPRSQPRTPQPQAIARITTSPFQQSPSPMSQSRFSVPPTPDEVKSATQPWHHDLFGDTSYNHLPQTHQPDNSSFPVILDWQHGVQPYAHLEATGSANLFEQHPEMSVNPADLELHPSEPNFPRFWDQQQNVRQLPYPGFQSNNQNQP